MNTIINAAYTDPRLEQIRHTTRSKPDSHPFLLLPVRIETRFMKVQQWVNTSPHGKLEDILRALAEAEINLMVKAPPIPPAGLTSHYTQLARQIRQINQNIDELPQLTRQQKSWLQLLTKGLSQRATAEVDSLRRPEQVQLRKTVLTGISALESRVEAVTPMKDPTFEAAAALVKRMNKLKTRLAVVNSQQLPYSSPENKKRLYIHIDRTLAEVREVYRESKDKIEDVKAVNKTQISRIRELHQEIMQELAQVPERLQRVHQDANWQAFVRQKALEIEALKPHWQHFELQVLTQLDFVQHYQKVRADELYFKGIQTLLAVQEFSQKEVSSYQPVKSSRSFIDRKVKTLSTQLKKSIEGSPGQVTQLQSLWEKVNSSFDAYNQKLSGGVQGLNRSQAFGAKVSVDFVNTKARQAMAPLTNATLPQLTFHNNQDIQQSASFYQQSLQRLEQVSQLATALARGGNTSEEELERLRQEVHAAADQFRIAGRKNLVFTSQDYTTLSAAVKILKTALSEVEAGSEKLLGEVAAIESSLGSQSVVKGDWSGGLVSALPELPALTTPTKTVNELWVRIYPDDLFVHTHEPPLTAQETEAGKRYWMAHWAASHDRDLEIGAWRSLKSSFGTRRAAWIARQLDPRTVTSGGNATKFNKRPSKPLLEVIRRLKEVDALLQKVSRDKTLAVSFGMFDVQALRNQLSSLAEVVEPLEKEQVHLLDKVRQELRHIESKLIILQQQKEALSPTEVTTLQENLQVLNTAFENYTRLRDQLLKIKPLSTEAYVEAFSEPFSFPVLATKENDWEVAPHTKVMPDRFVVITMSGSSFQHIVVGNPIPESLKLGLDPQKFDLDDVFKLDAEGNLIVDEGMMWMTDYHEAVKKGMGIRISLSKEQAQNGFDKVLVLGIKDADLAKGQQLLEELLENHHYATDGMEVLRMGTPTNNTSGEAAGFRSMDADDEKSYQVEMEGPLFDATEAGIHQLSDGKRLADALGVRPELFAHIHNSGMRQISNAFACNRVLWQATLGYYMEEIWDTVFTYDNLTRTKEYFTQNCLSRGILPSLRIGTQPYGILPTTAFSRFRFDPDFDAAKLPVLTKAQVENPSTAAIQEKLQLRYDIRLQQLLQSLNSYWTLFRSKVKHAQNVKKDGETPQQHFMDMLGLQATSVEYYFRYGVNIASRSKTTEDGFNVNFKEDDKYGPMSLHGIYQRFLQQGYFHASFDFPDENLPDSDPVRQLSRQAARIRDQFEKARLFKSRFLDKETLLKGNPAPGQSLGEWIDGQLLSETKSLELLEGKAHTYIHWLLHRDLYDILARNQIDQLPSNSILFLMLRQSLLLTYREAALNILQREGFFTEDYRKLIGSSEQFGVFHASEKRITYTSKWSYLFRDLNRLTGLNSLDFSGQPLYQHLNAGSRQKSMADYLYPGSNSLFTSFSGHNRHQAYINEVEEVRQCIAQLDGVPTAELDRLLSEHFDACTYRLDAWMLGLANRRLYSQRNKGATKGIHLGAYGWIENLRPGGLRKEAPDVPEGLYQKGGPAVYTDEDNEGFIHAPSLNHAISAAILRSGYVANAKNSTDDSEDLSNTLAVNLSSARVRKALDLISGIRNGLEVGAVLGFWLERGLHERYQEAELDKFILPLRNAFPLVVPVEDTAAGTEADLPSNVVNGSALLDKINEKVDILDFDPKITLFELLSRNSFEHCPAWLRLLIQDNGGGNAELTAVLKEIDRMADAFDALGDLAISESVYQVVQGNHVRAAAMLSALAEGKAPPDPQVVRTPRTGTVVTQRVLLNLDAMPGTAPTAPAGWTAPLTARAKAEPSLNKWLGNLLGNPNQIRCLAEFTTDDSSVDLEEVSLANLDLQPLDFLHMLGTNPEQGGSELISRVTYFVRKKKKLEGKIELNLKFTERDETWGEEVKSFYEMEPLLRQLRELLANSKSITADDLMLPPDEPVLDTAGQGDLEELRLRIAGAANDLKILIDGGNSFVTAAFGTTPSEKIEVSEPQFKQIREFLILASYYGLPGSMPDSAVDLGPEIGRQLLDQMKSVLKEGEKRVAAQAAEQEKLNPDLSVPQQIKIWAEVARQVFGKAFQVLVHYQPANVVAIKNQLSLPDTKHLLRHTAHPFAMDEWLQSIARVRPKMYAAEMTGLLTDTFGGEFATLDPVQFPYQEGDYWLGSEYPKTYTTDGDRLSLILMNSKKLTGGSGKKTGLVIDEWIEIIPSQTETTGITFNYDQPDATPPQSMLLAVTPELTGKWEWDDLVHTLLETLSLAKNRAVEPDHLDDSLFAQVLPAIMAEVVPPQLRVVTGSDGEPLDIRKNNPLGTQAILDFVDNLPKEVE